MNELAGWVALASFGVVAVMYARLRKRYDELARERRRRS